MSKISEQKALEAYPINKLYNEQCMMDEDVNLEYRIGYEEGYDQAMQDFLEKACEWWSTIPDDTYGFNPCKIYVEQFKNYMQDESEN